MYEESNNITKYSIILVLAMALGLGAIKEENLVFFHKVLVVCFEYTGIA